MTRVRGRHLTHEERLEVWRHLVQSGLTATKLAAHLGVSQETVYQARRDLMEAGLKALTGQGPRPLAEAPPPPDLPEPTPAERHDAAFYKRQISALQREHDQAQAVIRELGALDGLRFGEAEWLNPEPQAARSRAILIVHNSDRHMGEVVQPAEINGWNSYNPDVCRRRVQRFIEASIVIGQRALGDSVCDGVLYTMGGDEISGDIHDELRETNALTSLEQVDAAAELHVACIRRLLEVFPRVHVPAVPGNHGRTTKKPTAKQYGALSYDTMIARHVARALDGEERVSFDIAAGPDVVVTAYGRRILVTHGDKMGTGGGQGFAGPELPILRGSHKTRALYASAHQSIDMILLGHFHTSANVRGALANGSVVGMSEFGAAIRAPLDPPRQWMAVFREGWGLAERVDVQLEKPRGWAKPRIRAGAVACSDHNREAAL